MKTSIASLSELEIKIINKLYLTDKKNMTEVAEALEIPVCRVRKYLVQNGLSSGRSEVTKIAAKKCGTIGKKSKRTDNKLKESVATMAFNLMARNVA